MKWYVCPLTWPEDTSKAIYDLRLENAIDIQSEVHFWCNKSISLSPRSIWKTDARQHNYPNNYLLFVLLVLLLSLH